MNDPNEHWLEAFDNDCDREDELEWLDRDADDSDFERYFND